MCTICRQNPCASGCPNADEPRVIEQCIVCDTALYEGDTAYKLPDDTYACEDCNNHMRTTL